MAYLRLSEVNIGEHIGERLRLKFMVLNRDCKQQKNGNKYLSFSMVDGDKIENAKIFDITKIQEQIVRNGSVYLAFVDVKEYGASSAGYSCVLYNISEAPDEDRSSYIPKSKNPEKDRQSIQNLLSGIKDTDYHNIAYKIIVDNWDKFTKHSAAKGQHHNKIGELMTHTAEVGCISKILGEYVNTIYGENFVNLDLLVCSALIHDIGKVLELNVDETTGQTDYTPHAALCTHIMDVIGLVELTAYKLGIGETGNDKTDEQLELETEKIELLKHCVGAHHGKLEYGSPIEDSIPEAYILNKADNISADMYKYNREFSNLGVKEFSTVWANGKRSMFYKSLMNFGGHEDGQSEQSEDGKSE